MVTEYDSHKKTVAFDESQMGKPMTSNKLRLSLFLNDLNDSLIVHLQIPDNKSFLTGLLLKQDNEIP